MVDGPNEPNMVVEVGGMRYERVPKDLEFWWTYRTGRSPFAWSNYPQREVRLCQTTLVEALDMVAAYRERYGAL